MLCRVPSLAVRGLPEAVGSRRAWWAPYRRGRKQDGGLGQRGRRVPGPTGLPPVACREGAAWRWACRLGTGWSAGWTCGACGPWGSWAQASAGRGAGQGTWGPGVPCGGAIRGLRVGRPVPTPPRRASPCRRRTRTSVRCAGTAGSSSAVTAAPAPSTWPAWPPRCGRSPGEAGAPAPTGLHGDLHPLTLSGGHAGCGGACWCSSLGRGGARPRPQHPPARVATRSSQPGQQGPEGGKGGWRPKAKRGRPAPSHPTFRPRTPSTAHLYVRVRAHRDAELHPRTVHLPAPPPLATGRALSPTSARGSRGSDEGMGVQSCPACWATSPAHVSEPQGLWQ